MSDEKRICEGCGKLKRIHCREHCSTCYHGLGLNPKRVRCADCGKTRPKYAKGLCKSCYNKRLTYQWRKSHPEESKKRSRSYQQRRRSNVRTKS